MSDSKKLECDGISQTIAEWSDCQDIKIGTIYQRLYIKLPIKDVLDPSKKKAGIKPKKLECDGISQTIAEWSECTSVKTVTIYHHLSRGWNVQDAITKNAIGRPPSIPSEEMVGMRFGKLTVIRLAKEKNARGYLYECRCDCGNTVKCNRDSLMSGNTKSCGCYRIDRLNSIRTIHVKLYRCGNCTQYMKAWAQCAGVSPSTLGGMIQRGYHMTNAVNYHRKKKGLDPIPGTTFEDEYCRE